MGMGHESTKSWVSAVISFLLFHTKTLRRKDLYGFGHEEHEGGVSIIPSFAL
jgi:hypothetical protein